MYDSSITSQYLSQQNPIVVMNTKSGIKEIPFELEYHSANEVQQANDYFNNQINLDLYIKSCETSNVKIEPKNPDKVWDLDELKWCANERILCQWDADYFLTRYYKYLDVTGIYRQFDYLIPQRVNMRILARLQKRQIAIRKLTLKARQQGETTWSQGIVLHRLAYFSDVVSMISSLNSDSSGEMGKKFIAAMNKLPYWNRPHLKNFTNEEEYTYDNGSNFDLGSGQQKSIGRGRTPLICHLSELPFYKYFREAIIDSLLNSMHETIWLLQLFEGTAEQRDDEFHNLCRETIAGMDAGTTSMVFCFHPWCARRDLFPTEAWMRARSEAFETWSPKTETIAHATKLKNWVIKNQDYREEFGSNWKLSREQMFYYEIEKEAAKRRNGLQAFLKEKPSDPEEAFQHAGKSIYPIETIISFSDSAQKEIPQVYKLRGDPNEINPLLFPTNDEIKDNGDLITIRCNWNPAIVYSEFELIEVNFNGWDNFDPKNKFLIWEHPQNKSEYGLSVDTSDGLGEGISDDSVFEVIKKGTIEYKDKQVCEFATPELSQSMLWPFALPIATYYSPEEQLLFTPEVNKGTEILTDMINRGWSNIFQMLDMTRADKGIIESKRLGFYTGLQTRRDLVNHLNAFIIGKLVELHSMLLVGELKDLVIKESVSSQIGQITKKILGKKDNRFMAFGIGLYALHRDEILGFTKKSWEERIRNENSIIVLRKFKQDALAVDTASQSLVRMLVESEDEYEVNESEIDEMLRGLEEEEEVF